MRNKFIALFILILISCTFQESINEKKIKNADNKVKEEQNMSIVYEPISNKFYGRAGAGSCYFNSKYWIIGGNEGGIYKADVWNSDDCQTWTQVTADGGFHARFVLEVIVYDGKMWILGGSNGTSNEAGIYSSSDGVTWTYVGVLPSTYPMHAINAVVFDSKMWIFGGMMAPNDPGANRNNQIFSSTNGSSWTYHGLGAYGAREYSAVFAIGSYVYIVAGAQADYEDDCWRSSDAINFSKIADDAFTDRYGQKGAYYDSKMWVVCGTNAGAVYDAFYSADGVTWTNLGITLPYIYYPCLFVKDDYIYIVGGSYYNIGISRINFNYTPPPTPDISAGVIF